jgi:hypothetical protein
MLRYDGTVSLAIMSHLPNYDWKEWLFDWTPKGFGCNLWIALSCAV